MRLDERVGGRVRADERGVDRAGKNGRDGITAGIEGVCLEGYLRVERGREEALLQADKRRGVREVGKEAQPERERPVVGC